MGDQGVRIEYGVVEDYGSRVVELLKELKVLRERLGRGSQKSIKMPRFFIFVYDLYKLGLPLAELTAYASNVVKGRLGADFIVKVIEVMHGLEMAGLAYVRSEEMEDVMSLLRFRQVDVDPRMLGTMARVVYGVLGQAKSPLDKAMDIVFMFRMFPSVFTPYEHVMYSAYVDYILYFHKLREEGYLRTVGRRWIPYTAHLDSFFHQLLVDPANVSEVLELRSDLPDVLRSEAEARIHDVEEEGNMASLAWLINRGVLSEASMSKLSGIAESMTIHLASSLANSLLTEAGLRKYRIAEPQEMEKAVKELLEMAQLLRELEDSGARGDLVEQGMEIGVDGEVD